MNAAQFSKLTYGMDRNSPEYLKYYGVYLKTIEEEKKRNEYTSRLRKRLWQYLRLIRSCIQVSKLKNLSDKDLIEIGKASRALYEALKKAGLFQGYSDKHNNSW